MPNTKKLYTRHDAHRTAKQWRGEREIFNLPRLRIPKWGVRTGMQGGTRQPHLILFHMGTLWQWKVSILRLPVISLPFRSRRRSGLFRRAAASQFSVLLKVTLITAPGEKFKIKIPPSKSYHFDSG